MRITVRRLLLALAAALFLGGLAGPAVASGASTPTASPGTPNTVIGGGGTPASTSATGLGNCGAAYVTYSSTRDLGHAIYEPWYVLDTPSWTTYPRYFTYPTGNFAGFARITFQFTGLQTVTVTRKIPDTAGWAWTGHTTEIPSHSGSYFRVKATWSFTVDKAGGVVVCEGASNWGPLQKNN